MREREIAIFGGGPAGLFAAEHLSKLGHSVTVYEQMPTVGRKFLNLHSAMVRAMSASGQLWNSSRRRICATGQMRWVRKPLLVHPVVCFQKP